MGSTGSRADSERQLRSFIAKFSPADQKRIRAVRAALRKRFPAAHELVYDNYNFFVIGYSPTERPSDAILSIAAHARGLSICFIWGKSLPDPTHLLHGEGKQTRFLSVESASRLNEPGVKALLTAAAEESDVPMPSSGRGTLIIRSVSAKQRPRRRRDS